MASVQFKGMAAVLTAFENRGEDAWSLWCGKQFLFKGIGEGDLQTVLESLTQGGTNATYTLQIYEGIKNVQDIKSSSPHDGSFNFKLNADTQEILGGQYSSLKKSDEILARLESLEKRFEEDEDDEEPEMSIGAIGMEYLKDPNKLAALVNIFSTLTGRPAVTSFPANPAPVIGNVQTSSPGPEMSQEEQIMRIGGALEILGKQDPNLVTHLEKLAKLSQEKPDTFKFLLTTLEGM